MSQHEGTRVASRVLLGFVMIASGTATATPSPERTPGATATAPAALRTADSPTAMASPRAAAPAGAAHDDEIAAAVEGALMADASVPANRIDTAVSDGTVTLSGTVDDLFAKRRAERIAETVKGVRAVVSALAVEPGPSDATLREHVEAALLLDPATDSYEIATTVHDGRVTLTGVVQSGAERELAETVATSVAGVRDVANRLDVQAAARSDDEIRADIAQRMRWDRLLDDAAIDVAVADGVVTLTGTVGSRAERRRAGSLAWVTGARRLDARELSVVPPRDGRLAADKYDPKSDAEVTRAIERALALDPRVGAFQVDVGAANGAVTLRGTVDNLKAKREAERVARETVGVWRIRNLLKVRPATAVADATIAANLRDALRRDPTVDRHDVAVAVIDGTVHLTGEVDAYVEKAEAEDLAARVQGVTAVRNGLTVAYPEPGLVDDPYVYGWTPHAFDWYAPGRRGPWKTDHAIREDIEDQIAWSPFVDADQVRVTVKNGVATLRGTVDTWSEHNAAIADAYHGGATSVVNDLDVRHGAFPSS